MSGRHADLCRFYELLSVLEERLGGKRQLTSSKGGSDWPKRGLYFFFEPGEVRSDTGTGPRVVRVGTHALPMGSSSTLWQRLSQHLGQVRSPGGNHRGSIFRLLVGAAMMARDGETKPASWGIKADPAAAARSLGTTSQEVKSAERPLEAAVSAYIGAMPFFWLEIDDEHGPDSDRGIIERNCIALLSNFGRPALDAPSEQWLGRHSDRDRVRRSGL